MNIHPTAHISRGAKIGEGTTIGPHVIIGEHVEIGADCEIGAGAYLDGWTKIGDRNRISPYAVLGTPPQDLKFGGEESHLVIGSDNVIREFVTINRATHHGGGVTTIGSHNFIMAYAHIAHDNTVGDHNILANAATLAGHITIGNNVNLGGLSGVHQFVKIGSYAFIGGCSAVSQDIPPFALAAGNHAIIYGMNVIGLKRQGFSPERLDLLKKAYRILFKTHKNIKLAVQHIRETLELTADIEELLTFIDNSDRGLAKGIRHKGKAQEEE